MARTELMTTERACSCCGVDPLAVACESIVVRALEVLGKRIVRQRRSRWVQLGATPWYEVHTLWSPKETDVNATLEHAWDLVPDLCIRWGHDDPVGLAQRLDAYTRQLVWDGEMPTLEGVRATVEVRP